MRSSIFYRTFYSIDCDLCIMVFLNIITKRICYDQTATKIKQSLLSNRLSKWKRQEGMEQRREQFRVHHWVIEMMLSARIIVRWSCEIEMCWKETLASAREREQRRRKSTSTSLTRTHLSPATSVPSCSCCLYKIWWLQPATYRSPAIHLTLCNNSCRQIFLST